jgi:hypothetical protein
MTASEHPYHRSVAPMMWVFLGLAGLELVVTHFLLALWSWRVALLVSAISLSGVIWLIAALRSFRRMPVLLAPGGVTLRAGLMRSVTVSLGDIAGLRRHWDGEALKSRDVLNLALIAYPNVLLDLRAPIGRRKVMHIAHRLDDPDRFEAALAAAMCERGG